MSNSHKNKKQDKQISIVTIPPYWCEDLWFWILFGLFGRVTVVPAMKIKRAIGETLLGLKEGMNMKMIEYATQYKLQYVP